MKSGVTSVSLSGWLVAGEAAAATSVLPTIAVPEAPANTHTHTNQLIYTHDTKLTDLHSWHQINWFTLMTPNQLIYTNDITCGQNFRGKNVFYIYFRVRNIQNYEAILICYAKTNIAESELN